MVGMQGKQNFGGGASGAFYKPRGETRSTSAGQNPLCCTTGAELTMIHGGLVQLYRMVTEVTGKRAVPYYSSYGCHCGLGGRGRPKDTTDRCCQRHDCCYHQLQKRGCRPQITCYPYSYRWGEIQCGSRANWCQQETCSCDRALALCLKQNVGRYQKKYTFYPNFLCRGPAPHC